MSVSRAVIIALLLGLVLAVFVLFLDGNLTPETTLYAVIAQIAVGIVAYRYSRMTVFSPFLLIFFTLLLANLLRTLYVSSADDISIFRYFVVGVDNADLEFGALVVMVGSVALALGSLSYSWVAARVTAGPIRWLLTPSTRVSLFVCALSIVLLAALVLLSEAPLSLSAKRTFEIAGGETTRFGPLRFAMNILLFAMQYIFFIRLVEGVAVTRGEPLVVLFVIVLAAFVLSKRSYVLLTMLPVVLVYAESSSVVRKASVLILSLVSIIILAAITVSRSGSSDSVVFDVATVVESTTEAALVSANYGGFIPTAVSTAVVKDVWNEFPGKTLLVDPLVQFVPRFLYASKPEELGGRLRQLHQNIGVAPPSLQGGVPPGLFAELWLNGGLVLVAVGSFLIGVLFVWLSIRIARAPNPASVSFLFMFSQFIVFFGFGGHLARVFNYSVSFALALVGLRVLQSFLGGSPRRETTMTRRDGPRRPDARRLVMRGRKR